MRRELVACARCVVSFFLWGGVGEVKNSIFLRHGFFRRKKLVFAEKNFWGTKYEKKGTKIGVENREQHASQEHLSVLKTDSKSASMPRREYQSSCVCVPPGGPPEGILDIAEYIVCLVVFLLFLFGPQNFFRRKLKFFGEKTHVAFFFHKKQLNLWQRRKKCDWHTQSPTKRLNDLNDLRGGYIKRDDGERNDDE